MRAPTSIDIDLTIPAAYVQYGDGKCAGTRDIYDEGSVAVDHDAEGAILGIEVLHIDNAENLAAAAEFARANDLAFPRNLGGNIVS